MHNQSVLSCTSIALNNDIAIDVKNIREQFPSIKNNSETIYFDNSATTQKPQQVIDTISSYYEDNCANSGRAEYSLANVLHNKVEDARMHVARFINAESNDIAFTSGATNSLNLVATSWGLNNLADGDEIDLRDARYLHPETAGVDAILKGWLLKDLSDRELEMHGITLFDGLYADILRKEKSKKKK